MILHNHCSNFSWNIQSSQGKLKTMLMQNFGAGANKVHYGQFENNESGQYTLVIKHVNCKLTKLYLDANGIGDQ